MSIGTSDTTEHGNRQVRTMTSACNRKGENSGVQHDCWGLSSRELFLFSYKVQQKEPSVTNNLSHNIENGHKSKTMKEQSNQLPSLSLGKKRKQKQEGVRPSPVSGRAGSRVSSLHVTQIRIAFSPVVPALVLPLSPRSPRSIKSTRITENVGQNPQKLVKD